MVTLRFAFLTGHYHATPWGSHVNEGQPEWPPSPWRILRALIATWYLKGRDTGDEADLAALVTALAEAAPSYRLPEASTGHTRHWMPLGTVKNGYPDTTKVIDSFVLVGGHHAERRAPTAPRQLEVRWDIELPDNLRALLGTLAGALGYLGRAESLVECTLVDSADAEGLETNCQVLEPSDDSADAPSPSPATKHETLRLLAPELPATYANWQRDYLDALPKPAKGKKLSKDQQNKLPPDSLFDALLADTGELRKVGWSQPPGSRWLTYARPFRALTPKVGRCRPRPRSAVQVVRFALTGPVLPAFLRTIELTDRLHGALSAYSFGHTIFTGKDEDGPLTGHRHAYLLPEPNPRTGLIDRVTLYARDGFDDQEQRAFDKLQAQGLDGRDYASAGNAQRKRTQAANELRWTLIYKGDTAECRQMLAHEPDRPQLFGPSTVWRSLTPFLKTRHTKRRSNGDPKHDDNGLEIGSAEHDLLRLLAEAGHPPVKKPKPLPTVQVGPRECYWQQFQRIRRGDSRSAGTQGFGFELRFDQNADGPLALGYAAHFGLGLFVPVSERQDAG